MEYDSLRPETNEPKGTSEGIFPELRTLLFSNPVFHGGVNVTCRNGYKWADALHEIVKVADTDNVSEWQYAHILGVMTMKLDKIPETILSLEHDPECRTTDGIITEMKRVYGDELKDDAPTTVLFFEFESSKVEANDIN
jgi:hypothetical protein